MEIHTSPRFERHYKKLPKKIRDKAKEREQIFRGHPHHPLLHTHKLTGKEKDHWAFSITNTYRIKFFFLSDEEVVFLDIGSQDIYE